MRWTTFARWWRLSVRSAGNIKGGDVDAVGPGLIRLDLTKYDSTAYEDEHRVAAVLDLPTARAMTIALIESIKKAELEEALANKKRKK